MPTATAVSLPINDDKPAISIQNEDASLSAEGSTWIGIRQTETLKSHTGTSDISPKEGKKKLYSSVARPVDALTTQITDGWIEAVTSIIDSGDEKWLHKSITKSERYLIPLYGNREPRLVIAMYLMILRNNSRILETEESSRSTLSQLLKRYSNSNREASDRMILLRSLRRSGLSVIGS